MKGLLQTKEEPLLNMKLKNRLQKYIFKNILIQGIKARDRSERFDTNNHVRNKYR